MIFVSKIWHRNLRWNVYAICIADVKAKYLASAAAVDRDVATCFKQTRRSCEKCKISPAAKIIRVSLSRV